MKKINPTMLKAAILMVAVQNVAAGAAAPAVANIIRAFPTVSFTTIMLIVSLPSVVIIFASPIYGKLSDYFKQRSIFYFASLCFLIGGIGPAFLNDITPILFLRCVLGVGIGIFLPMSLALITDFYEDMQTRDTMMGLNMTIANIGGIIYQLLGGYLAAINWHYAFYTYLIFIIMFVFIFIFLPEPEKRKKEAADGLKQKLPWKAYGVALIYLVYSMSWFTLVTNTSILIEFSGYGDASSSGIALTLYTVGGLIGGAFFGFVIRAMKKLTMSFGYLLTAVGFVVCFLAPNLTMVFIGETVIGLGLGISIPGTYSKVTSVCSPATAAMGLSLVASAMAIGHTLQPILYSLVLKICDMEAGRNSFVISAVILIVMGLILGISSLLTSKTQLPVEIGE